MVHCPGKLLEPRELFILKTDGGSACILEDS
jgi:hypothetical protein